MSVDPTNSWNNIDKELWSLYLVNGPVSSLLANNPVEGMSDIKKSLKIPKGNQKS